MFFFSSRSRHTRSLRDWSSDVCSSDLFPEAISSTRDSGPSPRCRPTSRIFSSLVGFWISCSASTTAYHQVIGRSEERRVGQGGFYVLKPYFQDIKLPFHVVDRDIQVHP